MGRRRLRHCDAATLLLGTVLLGGRAAAQRTAEAEAVAEQAPEPDAGKIEAAPEPGADGESEGAGEAGADAEVEAEPELEPPPPDSAPPEVEYSEATLAAGEAPRTQPSASAPERDRGSARASVLDGSDIRHRRTKVNAELGVTTLLLRGKSGLGAHLGLGAGPFAGHFGGGGLMSWSDVPEAGGSWLGPYLSAAGVVTPIGGDDFELHVGLGWDAFFLTAVHPDTSYHGVAALVGGRYYLTRHMAAYARVDVFAWRSEGLELSAVPLLGSIGVAWTAWQDPPKKEEEP